MKKKRGFIVFDNLLPWIIALAVLVFSGILFIILNKKGEGALEFLKGILGF